MVSTADPGAAGASNRAELKPGGAANGRFCFRFYGSALGIFGVLKYAPVGDGETASRILFARIAVSFLIRFYFGVVASGLRRRRPISLLYPHRSAGFHFLLDIMKAEWSKETDPRTQIVFAGKGVGTKWLQFETTVALVSRI
jgi:hypothetical protein